MSGDCPRIVASGTSCDCVRPCSSKWPEKEFEMDLKQLSREELEIAFYNMHTKNECLSKALKDNVKQIKRLNKIIKKNEEDRRRCLSPTKQLYEDRISQLEQANTFLQDKVLVLRHQLQSHSRLHAKAHRNSSHHSRGIHSTKTSQTHLSHLPIPPDPENINEDGKNDSNENLNVDLAENDSRILQLQNELEQNPSDAAKVAENIEMIRLRRLVKRQTAQLSTMNAHLEMADKELDQLRSSYNEANLENDQVLKQLMSEKQRLREVQNELIELGNLKQDIKILQEQVRDLLSERTLLRSNNDKLLEIASGKAEEDTSQQPKNDTEKEIVEKDTKEESEKIFTNTIEAMGTISQHQMNTILEESLAKKTSRKFVKHNLFKKIISKACSTNTYDLGIEPRTEDSLFKAFSHQVLSDIFSKQYFRPSTLNYTIMPLIQASDESKEEKGDEKKNEDKHNQNISSENDGVPMIANEDDNENFENKRNSELSVDEAKFIFMQLLKNELENYVATSDQVLNSVENEANLTNENNRAENDPRTLIPPSGLVDYFWGMVGYKMFFPKKSLQIIDEAEIREHSEDASIRSNMENYVLSDVSPPYHTISISEKSVGVNDSIEGCILLIENPGNRLNSYWNPNYNEPKFDIESDDSQTIDIFSYRTIDSDLQTNEEPIPGNTEPKSRAEGDASTSNSTRTSVSTKQLSATEGESEMIREMLENGEIFVIKFEDSDCDPNLSKTLVNDENKDSTAEKSSTSSEHSQAPINESQILNENSTIEKDSTGSENSQTPINKSQVLDTNKNSTAKTGRTGLDHNQTPINGSQALDENKNSTAKTGRTGLDHNQTPINGSQALDTNKKSTAEKDITGSDRSLTLGDGPQLENGSNKCSCNSSSGAGQYILEELKPDLSRNGADSEENSIKNLPEQEKAAFIVYNLNSGTGSRHKIGVLFLKKIGCECNLKPITERQTRDSQLPFSSKGSEANEVSEKTTRIPEQSENVQSSREPEPDVDFEQIQLNNDEKEMQNPISVDNSFPTSNKQTVQGVSSAPLLTLLRRLLQKIIGEPVSETTGPSFSVIDGDESNNTIYSGSHHEMYDAVIESPNTRYLDSVDSMPDSSNKELFRMSSKHENNGDNDTNDIVVNSKVSLEPPNESEFFERNSENVVTRQNESFRRSSDPGPSKFVTKTLQTQTYNRVPLDRNEGIVDEYICSSGQTVRKMRGDDNRTQNHDHESTNTHKSANKSPDSKISQTSKVKNYGNPLPTNLARSVNKSPVSKTSQPMNDKNQGKSVEVLKVSSSFRDRSPKKTSKENSVRRYEFRKQPTYQTRDTVSPNRLNQNNSLPGSSGGYHSRCTTPVNNNDEGSRRSPYVQKVQSNQPNNRVNKVSVGNSEGSARNTRERYEKHNQAKPIIKVSSTPTPLKPIISSHEREIVNSIKRLIELLDKNLNNNENSSADELLSNDGSGSLYSGRRLAFSIPEGERIGSAKSDSRVSSERGCSSNSSQLSSDQSQPKECPTSLNRKLRLQQLDVSNDSPFSKKGENSKQTNRNDKRSINHEVDRSDPESSRHRPSQPEMIIVVGKKLTIYEEDDKEDEK